MSKITKERLFEEAIVESLVNEGGYSEGSPEGYSPELGMFREEVLDFLKSSQPEAWQKLSDIHKERTEEKLIKRLCEELERHGILKVLRNGFKDYGVDFKMAYFKPETGLNPETIRLYGLNRLKVVRQLHFSQKSPRLSIDLVLTLNGIPLATLELKSLFSGQSAAHARRQYERDRDKRELLFAFKKRALVHFAVDSDEVYMTTKLDGNKTFWLPFNKGHNNGSGNPPNPEGYRTAYLWEEILAGDSWMDIVGRFIHLQEDRYELDGRYEIKEKMIFPRFHQLEVVRRLTEDAREHGPGKNYLVQHSAGSGKSNSIAWLAHRLSSLHDSEENAVFDSIVVVTDRKVLDSQLQKTIYQFEHKSGLVNKIEKDSAQLAEAINKGSSIIITTLQKFPYILEQVEYVNDRKYAVIIDEAHSSQGGEASKSMKEVLATLEHESAVSGEDYDSEDVVNELVERSAEARGQHANLSFFAFTATPKHKTLAVFGQKDSNGKYRPFHLYSMRQAIDEGFIHDVLKNYTSYELYYKLTKAVEDDPRFNKKEAAKAIGRYLALHPYNVSQKTKVIVEHFRQVVIHKIGGKAKAMLVTGSRLSAVNYYQEFQKYINEKGYNNVKVLVAFSGKVESDAFPDGVSEPELTTYSESELPKKFEKEHYKILIVADKYQTGFDQPLLHTMYVDKVLTGVKAVQTLSRLNRTAPGKEDTFVLDFANERDAILNSFQPFYESTVVNEEPDPNRLYDIKIRLDEKQIYWQSEIDAFTSLFFRPQFLITPKSQKELNSFIDPAVERFKAIDDDDEQNEFKKALRTWCNLYSFLSQIIPFRELEFEKFYAYAKLLHKKLPRRDGDDAIDLDDDIALEYYRLQKVKEGSIDLAKGEEGELKGGKSAGLKKSKDDVLTLSEIIKLMNERFGTDFDDADRLFFEQLEEELVNDEDLQKQAKANKMDTFSYAFDDNFLKNLLNRVDQNQEIFNKIIEDTEFGDLLREYLKKRVYARLNKKSKR